MKRIIQLRLSRRLRLVFVILLSGLLPGCENIEISAPPPSIVWFIGFDVTTSIPANEFAEYKNIARKAVLSRLKNRDNVHILLIDSDPEDNIKSFILNSGRTGLVEKILEIDKYIQDEIQQSANYRGTTNIGGFLTFVKRNISESRNERANATAKGATLTTEPLYVALLLTDGHPDGEQTNSGAEWHDDIHLSAWGVHDRHAPAMLSLCQRSGIPEKNLQLVRLIDAGLRLENFGLEWNRPLNEPILKSIETKKVHTGGL